MVVRTEVLPWRRVLRQVTAALQGSGLDVLAPLSLEWYNAAVPPALHLPYLGRDHAPLAILVGNSKAIWKPFISALRSQQSLLNSAHPFNTFVKQSLTAALSASFRVSDSSSLCDSCNEEELTAVVDFKRVRAVIYWGHDTRPGKLVAMQRLAHLTGVAFFDESSNLCLHPRYGPWFALRAVVLFDVDPPTIEDRPQPLQSRPMTASAACEKVKEIKGAIEEQTSSSADLGFRELSRQWRLWVAVRDAIQPNHPMRYESDQIEYHYTHNKELLIRLAAPLVQRSP